MDKVNEILENLGFEGREIKIYLSLLKNREQTALEISRNVNVDRTTVYDILQRLKEKGVVSFIVKNKTKHFNSLSAEELLVYYKEKYNSLKEIIPNLKNISDEQKEVLNVEVFEGVNGLKTVVKDLIESKNNYKVIGLRKAYDDIFGYFKNAALIRLNEAKVREKAIVSSGEEFAKLKKGNYRYLDSKIISKTTTVIYGDVVLFFIWKISSVVRMKSKILASVQEEYFNLLWEIAKV
jgi:sugar-specific transcriptional regulator TrmB